MENSELREIYFHVGTGKTGTTFLQYRVFPKLRGIYYIQRTRYNRVIEIISKSKHQRILVSREFDQQLEVEIKKFTSHLPDTTPIIVFRRHDSYIASQYRRFVKNGFTGSFSEFFDLKKDEGKFKKSGLEYCRQIKLLETHFQKPPIVLFYEDLKDNPKRFIESLAERLNTQIDFTKVDTSSKHASYSEKQLKAILWVARYLNIRRGRRFENDFLNLFARLYLDSIRYGTLYFSKLFPETWFSSKPLIAERELEAVRAYYEDDWKRCHEMVKSS